MMDTDLSGVDGPLGEGLGIDGLLSLGAVLAAICWGGTQFLANRPGLALDLVGVAGPRAVVGLWIGATLLLAAVAVVAGAPGLRYSPLLWLWGVLVGATLAVGAAAVSGYVPPRTARTLLWTPWPIVLGLGYLVTGLLAAHRARAAYLIGAVLASLVLLAAVLFPSTVGDWAFAATGVVHAAPLAADAVLGGRGDRSRDGRSDEYVFRDPGGAAAAEEGGESR